MDREHDDAYGRNDNSKSLRDNEAENVIDRADPTENGAGSRSSDSDGSSGDGEDKK